MEDESIVIIDIALYFNMEHTSTAGRGGLSTGVIYKGIILNHYICISDGNDSGSSNTDDAENSIVSFSSSYYWGITKKRTKEEIVQRHVVCVNNKSDPEGSMEHNIHHANTTKLLSKNFGSAKHFIPKK